MACPAMESSSPSGLEITTKLPVVRDSGRLRWQAGRRPDGAPAGDGVSSKEHD
jgi:hypothetical protein